MTPTHTVLQQVSDICNTQRRTCRRKASGMKAESSYSPCSLTKKKIFMGFGHLVVRTVVEKEHFTLNFILENKIYEGLALIPFGGL